MIATTHLKAEQLEQLEALLADTTAGAGRYRPPVARNIGILWDLGRAGLTRYVEDVNFETYEILDAGKAIVVGRAMDAAAREAFLRCASRHELRETIASLKAVFNDDQVDPALREQTLADIEACQDRLDELADGQSESTGRHRVIPADDRPTQILPPVQEQTAPMPSTSTLPGIAVVEREQPDEPDQDSAERLLAAIKGADTGDDVYDEQTAEWAALEADLGEERSWRRRRPFPWYVPVLIATVSTAIGTWSLAWLVMG